MEEAFGEPAARTREQPRCCPSPPPHPHSRPIDMGLVPRAAGAAIAARKDAADDADEKKHDEDNAEDESSSFGTGVEIAALFAVLVGAVMVGAVVRAASVLVVRFALWRAGGGARWVVRVWRCGWASRGRAGGSGIIPHRRCRCLLSTLPSHASRCNARRPSQPSSRDHHMGPGSCNTRSCTGIQLAVTPVAQSAMAASAMAVVATVSPPQG